MKHTSNIFWLTLIYFSLTIGANEFQSIKIADIQSFRWDAD